MSISPKFLDELRNRVTLSEIIGRRVKVTRAGREFKACCPFHHEKTPSFTINDDKQFYHCFGCGAHGDVINFVMQHDNISFIDSVELLAAEAGLQVPKPSPQAAAKAKKEKDLYELMDDATAFMENHLRDPRNSDALRYIIDRGLSEEMLKEFRIGFAPEDGQVLRKHLKDKGYTDKDMIIAGIVKPSSKGGEPYSFFRDRIIFPVPDRRKRIVAFGGRILPDHLRPPNRSDFTPPKYINSSETPLFHKGSMLYGEPIARRAAADGEPLILVEGYLDVIACVQAGLNGALAPMGTAVTDQQILTMWKMIPDFTKIPILCFDGDNAGRKAARRVCENILPLLEPGRSVNFAFMPEGEDPDSLIKSSGVKGFKDILNSATPLFDFIWNFYTAGREFKTPELRAGVIKQMENEVKKIANQDVQLHYRSLLRQKVSDTFFSRMQQPYTRYQKAGKQRLGLVPTRPRPAKASAASIFPRVLLAAVINHPHIFDSIEERLSELSFQNQRHEALKQCIISILSQNSAAKRENLVKDIENAGFFQELGDICNESVYVHASFCSPTADENDVHSKWLTYWNDGQRAGLLEEIRKGWKNASNEQDEEKLKELFWMDKSADDAF
ncbi:MAG: DNA primase [Alphaproteobacteria bacterium]|nr:DNA primase [Alphaproteobacteria bacterium]